MRTPCGIPIGGAVLLIAAGAVLVSTAAGAAPVPQTGSSGLLTLDADPYPAQNLTIAPGERVLWTVTAELDAPTPGDLTVRVTSEEPLTQDADALRFELASCPEAWVLPADDADPATCAGGPGTVEITEAAFALTDADETFALGPIAPDAPRYFLVTLSLPPSTHGSIAGESGRIAFGFFAADRARDARLAATGGELLGPAFLGAGLLLGGFTLARARRSRS